MHQTSSGKVCVDWTGNPKYPAHLYQTLGKVYIGVGTGEGRGGSVHQTSSGKVCVDWTGNPKYPAHLYQTLGKVTYGTGEGREGSVHQNIIGKSLRRLDGKS